MRQQWKVETNEHGAGQFFLDLLEHLPCRGMGIDILRVDSAEFGALSKGGRGRVGDVG